MRHVGQSHRGAQPPEIHHPVHHLRDMQKIGGLIPRLSLALSDASIVDNVDDELHQCAKYPDRNHDYHDAQAILVA